MYIKKNLLLSALFLTTTIAISKLFDSYTINSFIATLIFLTLLSFANWKSGINMMFMAGFAVFIYTPSLVNGYYFDTEFTLFQISSLISLLFLALTSELSHTASVFDGRKHRLEFYYSGIIIAALSLFKFSYVTPLFGPFIMFFALSLNRKSLRKNVIAGLFFLIVFSIYSIYGWSGYGRTVSYGFLICAALYFLYAQELKINKILFTMTPALGGALLSSRSLLNLEFHGFENAANDSAYGPYRQASAFIDDHKINGTDIPGFLDQILFTLTSFVPREIWPSKPYGFGFEYVVRHMDSYLADSGHSIASTLIGDHIYFLGYWGVITAAMMVFIVAKICKIFYSIKTLRGFGVTIMASYMMVFVWGGMTSLSARLIIPIASLALIFIAYKVSKSLHSRNL